MRLIRFLFLKRDTIKIFLHVLSILIFLYNLMRFNDKFFLLKLRDTMPDNEQEREQ